jgi:hypothetical protein
MHYLPFSINGWIDAAWLTDLFILFQYSLCFITITQTPALDFVDRLRLWRRVCTISELDWEGEERAALRTTYIGTHAQGKLH